MPLNSQNSRWSEVSLFESFDYVQSWHQWKHKTPLRPAKTSQINAFFAQGREYFRNAASADLSVKPLLLYYGVLSLSRGLILLNDTTKTEDDLQGSHGLKVVRWKPLLKDGIGSVLELEIKTTKGTFRELTACCPNRHRERSFREAPTGMLHVDYSLGRVAFADDNSTLTLDALLSRLMATAPDYQRITGRQRKWVPASVTSTRDETRFAIHANTIPDELSDLLQDPDVHLGATDLTPPGERPTGQRAFTLIFKHLPHHGHHRKLPFFHYSDGSPSMDVILSFPNGDKLNEFFKLYLVSYILGMLARYYPSKWMTLLRGGQGDFAQPLLVASIDAIESLFPRELSNQIPRF